MPSPTNWFHGAQHVPMWPLGIGQPSQELLRFLMAISFCQQNGCMGNMLALEAQDMCSCGHGNGDDNMLAREAQVMGIGTSSGARHAPYGL